jgi:hypothetical protein
MQPANIPARHCIVTPQRAFDRFAAAVRLLPRHKKENIPHDIFYKKT